MELFGNYDYRSPMRDGFADLLVRKLKAVSDTRTPTYRPADFSLCFGDDQLSLEALYQEYLAISEDQHDHFLSNLVKSLSEPITQVAFDDLPTLIFPVIRSRMVTNNRALHFKSERLQVGDEALAALTGDLCVGFVIDRKWLQQTVVLQNLDDWNVSLDDLLAIAVTNLAQQSKPYFIEISPDIYKSNWQDGYDAARLLHLPAFSSLNTSSEMVAIPTNADQLFVTTRDDPDSLLNIMKPASESLLNHGKSLGPNVLKLIRGRWEIYIPPNDHPAFPLYDTLEKQWMGALYEEQKTALAKLYPNPYADPFISAYSIAERNGRCYTYATWTEGVACPLWLPKTDLLVLMPLNGSSVIVEWERVEAVLGSLKKVASVSDPVRFEVVGFPTPHQLSLLSPE